MASGIGEARIVRVRDANRKLDLKLAENPVAMATEWEMMSPDDTRWYKLHIVTERLDRLELTADWRVKLVCVAMMAGGAWLAWWAYGTPGLYEEDMSMVLDVAIGCVLFLAGMTCLGRIHRPLVFDKKSGRFGKGRLGSMYAGQHGDGIEGQRMEKICSLQLLRAGSSDGSLGMVFHLNLVLENGSRVNVLRSGDEHDVMHVAETVSRFVDRPVWDAR